MKWVWLLAMGCSGAPHANTPAMRERACVQLAATPDVHGLVTDRAGHPLAGVTIAELMFTRIDGSWRRMPAGNTTTSTDGKYHLALVHQDAVVEFDLDGRKVVWGHVSTPARIDVEIDPNARPGVLAMFDRSVRDGDSCSSWHCPVDRDPVPEWWTRPDPCPDGGQLLLEVAGAHCELAGERHGPTTSWIPVEHGWAEETGWYEHGKRCGKWHMPALLDPPAHEP